DAGHLVAVCVAVRGDVDLAGIDGQGTGDERDVVEAVGHPRLAPATDPHPHSPALPRPSGWPPGSPNIGIAARRPTRCGAVYRPRCRVSTLVPGSGGMRPLPQQSQPLEGEVLVHVLEGGSEV